MPATPDGGDGDAIAHGYAAGEEAYLASIRREEEGERHPLHWQVACIAAGVWIVAVALAALAWGVLR